MKNANTFFLILLVVIVIYVLRKMGENQQAKVESKEEGGNQQSVCVKPDFPDVVVNVADCRGSYVDENRQLKLGNWGCDVVVLQQRLNMLEKTNILQPTGKFDCLTLEKLQRVKNVSSMSLNGFEPDEQIGLDTLRPSNVYSTQRYMDLK